jgi:hypothetical protein
MKRWKRRDLRTERRRERREKIEILKRASGRLVCWGYLGFPVTDSKDLI